MEKLSGLLILEAELVDPPSPPCDLGSAKDEILFEFDLEIFVLAPLLEFFDLDIAEQPLLAG